MLCEDPAARFHLADHDQCWVTIQQQAHGSVQVFVVASCIAQLASLNHRRPKADFTHQRGTKNSDEYEGTDRASSSSSESLGANMTKMLSALSAGTKDNSPLSKKRIALIEKEKTNLNKLKMEIRLNKVPKCMNVNDAFNSLVEQLDAMDHLADNFDEKFANYKEASSPMVRALKQFV